MSCETTPLRPDCNYIGIEFGRARWENVRRCCIFPPDAAFAAPLEGRDDGRERVAIFWCMDEPDAEHRNSGQKRPRLHTIFAAFRELYQRCHANLYESITLHMLRRRETKKALRGRRPARHQLHALAIGPQARALG